MRGRRHCRDPLERPWHPPGKPLEVPRAACPQLKSSEFSLLDRLLKSLLSRLGPLKLLVEGWERCVQCWIFLVALTRPGALECEKVRQIRKTTAGRERPRPSLRRDGTCVDQDASSIDGSIGPELRACCSSKGWATSDDGRAALWTSMRLQERARLQPAEFHQSSCPDHKAFRLGPALRCYRLEQLRDKRPNFDFCLPSLLSNAGAILGMALCKRTAAEQRIRCRSI